MKATGNDAKIRPDAGSYRKLVRDSDPAPDTDGTWLITLSDVLSLLLVFFVVFHYMSANAVKEGRRQDNISGKRQAAAPALRRMSVKTW